jgi:hypothetical protein
MADIMGLQTAINRYAGDMGFTPIAVDGIVGPETLQAAGLAMEDVAGNSQEAGGPIDAATLTMMQGFASSSLGSTGALQSSADEISAMLNTAANELGFPPIPAPNRQPARTVTPTKPRAQAALQNLQNQHLGMGAGPLAGLWNVWSKVPAPFQIGAVVLAVLGGMHVYKKRKEMR